MSLGRSGHEFSPVDRRATPVLAVEVDGTVQTVARVLEREGGGRSFGTTLDHFHDNYAIPAFRQPLVNGILWTAGLEVPAAGAAVRWFLRTSSCHHRHRARELGEAALALPVVK